MNIDEAYNRIAKAIDTNSTKLSLSSFYGEKLSTEDFIQLLPHIKKIKNLKNLSIRNNNLKNASFLRDLPYLQSLDLSNNKLRDLNFLKDFTDLRSLTAINNKLANIDSLVNLLQLTTLDIKNNHIVNADILSSLPSLKTLYLIENPIKDISFLKELLKLQTISFTGIDFTKNINIDALLRLNSLTSVTLQRSNLEDVNFLENFQNLRLLNLNNNRITEIGSIRKLSKLFALYLDGNKLDNVSELRSLLNLGVLTLYGNKIGKIDFLEDLLNLQLLSLGFNQITNINSLKSLKSLYYLGLSGNDLTNIDILEDMISLENLYLNRTNLTSIDFLKNLKNLKVLDLTHNKISDVSIIKHLPKLKELYLYDNDLDLTTNLNRVIHSREYEPLNRTGINRIIKFYEDVKEQGEETVYEAKVLIIGEPDAGKSSLFNKLLDPNYVVEPGKINSTLGINIKTLPFEITVNDEENKLETKEFKAHLWDFGGQKIQYILHQYFFTERSLYVLLADNRKELANFNYWLEVIATFGQNCPLIILFNNKEIDKSMPTAFNFDVAECKKAYNNRIIEITDYKVDFSLPNDINSPNLTNFDALKFLLQNKVSQLEHIGKDFLPAKSIEIRNKLIEREEPIISTDDFFEECKKHQIYNTKEDKKAERMLNYLHDFGIALWYKSDSQLRNKVLLKPNWVIDALYVILKDETIIKNGGKFTDSLIFDLWEGYTIEQQTFLLSLMQRGKFEVAYKLKNSTDEYIAPSLLSTIKPEYEFDEQNLIQIYFAYDFMPYGIISRLIVRLHENIVEQNDKQIVWQKGVLLKYKNSMAEIRESIREKKLTIKVSGNTANDNRELLTIIRNNVVNVHYEVFNNKLDYTEYIFCNCNVCKKIKGDYLSLTESEKQELSEERRKQYVTQDYKLDDIMNYLDINEEIVCNKSVSAKSLQKRNPRHLLEGVYIEAESKRIDKFASNGNEFHIDKVEKFINQPNA
jgi:internalin A